MPFRPSSLDAGADRRAGFALDGHSPGDPDGPAPGPAHTGVQHLVETLEFDGDDRQVQAGRDHPDSRPERAGLPAALGKNQDGVAVVGDVADVTQRLSRAGFTLGSGNALKNIDAR